MRIEGYIEHPNMKITIFKMDNRYSVKFETAYYEQTYKLRKGTLINSVADIHHWVDDSFIENVLQHFNAMHRLTLQRNAVLSQINKDEFDVII